MGVVNKIRGPILTAVYLMLLITLVLPHHHHEDLACYTATHCEDETLPAGRHAEEPMDHHHDNSPADQPEGCLSSAYYIHPDGSPGSKRLAETIRQAKHDLPNGLPGILHIIIQEDIPQVRIDRAFVIPSARTNPQILAGLSPRAPPHSLAG